MKASTLKPGLLVALHTTIKGGVNYVREDISPEHTDESGARVAEWQTRREIPDPAEFDRAKIARGRARSLISSVCCHSNFGLLCPSEREADLESAIAQARAVAAEHNNAAALSRVDVYVLVGRVAQDDAEAARAIGAEVRELIDAMRQGIREANPAAIREAANKARALGEMLSLDVAGKVTDAIAEARAAARMIVKRVEKGAERAAVVVEECSTVALNTARFAFLDLDEGAPAEAEEIIGRDLDISPEIGAQPSQDASEPGHPDNPRSTYDAQPALDL